MKKYINKLHEMLKNDIEPDIEDIYLADIEAKANNYNNLKQALIDIREYFNRPEWEEDNLPSTSHWNAKENILQIIDKVLGDD